MKSCISLLLALTVLCTAGCAKVIGPYYLEQEKYAEGIEVLGERFRENPDDASSAFYVGRYYLALNKPEEGLPYLEKAVSLAPDNADYVFWTGVGYWAILDFEREEAAYKQALLLDPKHISANLYLGHGYVDRGKWAKALSQYDTVLALDKYNPEALYNRAVALEGLGKKTEEIAAWKKFLEYYPDGSLAMEATARLNLQGDFLYRNFIIGKRNVTLRSMTFKPGTTSLDADSQASLDVLSAMMLANEQLTVHIVVFQQGDAERAKVNAKAVRDSLLNGHSDIDPARLPLSWFGTAELIDLGENTFTLDRSVKFITEIR
ncbi:tetratricopeptide repeat protein [uncultured Pseudodesulfovibrio sp.]|uniref:tetratricopeptide repeat protein n=1 Tax=uncultured Pseudodesulfovibrio sp. TaxID=2035858 RepID=UPI0029C72DD1|nr:tetratricopeptide repeat protein [uncultured Pseudodesulfovibrio sp.]